MGLPIVVLLPGSARRMAIETPLSIAGLEAMTGDFDSVAGGLIALETVLFTFVVLALWGMGWSCRWIWRRAIA